MAAPTKFKRDWIADHFAGALLEAWQCVHASISAIQLTVNASSIDQANHVDERSAQGGAA
jgi:chromosomal replication initiation ATPase DnaA